MQKIAWRCAGFLALYIVAQEAETEAAALLICGLLTALINSFLPSKSFDNAHDKIQPPIP